MEKEILADEPIEEFSDDLLSRKSFVENLSSSLKNWNQEKSLIIGLFGKWGSGKSSIINLVEKQFKEDKEKVPKKEKSKTPIIIKFNPWGYSETEDLLEPFIRQLQNTLKGPDKIKGFTKKLENYLDILKLIPSKKDFLSFWSAFLMILSFVGVSLPQLFPNIANWIKQSAKWVSPVAIILSFILLLLNSLLAVFKFKNKNLEKSVVSIKKEICDLLKKQNRKIVIIIDDIDRLSSKEIKQLFRIVRSNADFPNTIYLLSFDREIVENSLDVQNQIDGREYLEKIINIEYDLPAIPTHVLSKILIKELNDTVSFFSEEETSIFEYEKTKWSYVYEAILTNITTIREIKRYINAIRFKLSQYINKGILEINLIDFFAIEFIRLKFPEYYNYIRNNKYFFTLTKDNLKYKIPNKKEVIENWYTESFSGLYSTSEKDCLDSILTQIFPAIRYCTEAVSSIIASPAASTNDKYCSIASEKYFDIYFNHVPGIPENECSNFDIQRIKSIANDYNCLMDTFREYIQKEKVLSLISLLENYSVAGKIVSETDFIPFFAALFDIIEELPEKKDFLSFDNKFSIYRIFYFQIKNKTKEDNYKLLEALFDNVQTVVMLIEIMKNENEYLKKQNIQKMIITEEEYKILKEKLLERLDAIQDNLVNCNFYTFVIHYWNNNDSIAFQSYAEKNIATDTLFLNILDKMIYKTRTTTIDKVFENDKFDFKTLKLFIDLDIAKKRIEEINNNSEKLYSEHKKSIDLFLKYFDYRNHEFIPVINE